MEVLVIALIVFILYGIYRFFHLIFKEVLCSIKFAIRKIRHKLEEKKARIKKEKEKEAFLKSLIPDEERKQIIDSLFCYPPNASKVDLEEYLFFDIVCKDYQDRMY